MEKIKTILWFLRRPFLYKQLIYQIRQSLFPHAQEQTRQESTEWCEANCVSTFQALEKMGIDPGVKKVEDIYANDFEEARKIEQNLHIKMGGAGDFNLLFHLAKHYQCRSIIETGVAYGWSSLSLLLALEDMENGLLISTDMPYAKMDNESSVGCVIPKRLKSKWRLIRRPDRQGLPVALRNWKYIDMCHYDSDKSYRGRAWAYPILWEKLTQDGIFISDDINDNLAFKHFADSIGVEPTVVKWNNQFVGVLIKK